MFTLYIDDLLKELSLSNVGCYWDNVFVGALAYADDLTLLAPSPSVLRKFLAICEKSGSELRLKSNPDKTQSLGSVERDLEDMELHISFVASKSDVLSMCPIFRKIWIFRAANALCFLCNSDNNFDEFNSFVFPKKGERQSMMKVTVIWKNFHFQYFLKCLPTLDVAVKEIKSVVDSL